MTDEMRFGGKAGDDYDQFRLACPQYDEVEDELRKIIKRTFKGSALPRIEVLEIGTGHGFTTKHLIHADRRVYVTTLDSEPKMTEQANDNLREFVLAGRVELVLEDALAYLKKAPSSSFD